MKNSMKGNLLCIIAHLVGTRTSYSKEHFILSRNQNLSLKMIKAFNCRHTWADD